MISAGILKAAVTAIREIRPSSEETLANLTPHTNIAEPSDISFPEWCNAELPTLTHAEIADFMTRAGWNPTKAEELARIEYSVDFGYGLEGTQLQVIVDLISDVPEDERHSFQLDLIELLARWLLRRRDAIAPNGGAVIGVRSLTDAKRIVAGWIEDKISRKTEDQKQSLGIRNSGEPVPASNSEARTNSGRIDLGRTISTLLDELRHLRNFARGRRKTESHLRSTFPDLQLWREIDTSESLSPKDRRLFFEKSLDLYGRARLTEFIGGIVGLSGPTAYKLYKAYRDYAGLKRKRNKD